MTGGMTRFSSTFMEAQYPKIPTMTANTGSATYTKSSILKEKEQKRIE